MEDTKKEEAKQEEPFVPLYVDEDTSAMIVNDCIFTVQVCVPEDWSDMQAEHFGEDYEIRSGCGRNEPVFRVHKAGGRVSCAEREGFVHLLLEP